MAAEVSSGVRDSGIERVVVERVCCKGEQQDARLGSVKGKKLDLTSALENVLLGGLRVVK